MGEKFTKTRIERLCELRGIEEGGGWPFNEDYIDRLRYFIGIDWSGTGNTIKNKNGGTEMPVFYVARGSRLQYMACIRPPKGDGTRHAKYRDLDSIAKIQDVTDNEELWYCAIDQSKLPKDVKINEMYNVKIITKLISRISGDRELPFSAMGIIVDGWFDEANKYLIAKKFKMKDKKFSGGNIFTLEEADRDIRIVNSADSIAYYFRNHYIGTGEMLRQDRRVMVGEDLIA